MFSHTDGSNSDGSDSGSSSSSSNAGGRKLLATETNKSREPDGASAAISEASSESQAVGPAAVGSNSDMLRDEGGAGNQGLQGCKDDLKKGRMVHVLLTAGWSAHLCVCVRACCSLTVLQVGMCGCVYVCVCVCLCIRKGLYECVSVF